MERKKIVLSCVIVFTMLLISSLFLFTHIKRDIKIKRIKQEVIDFLDNKYDEEFTVLSIKNEKNSYNDYSEEDALTKYIDSSYIYTLTVQSSRLVEFPVIYVDYEKDNYDDFKNYDIIEQGIYENYIYEYKIRDIKQEIKQKILETFSNANNLDVSIENITLSPDNILVNRSLQSDELTNLYDDYRKMNKAISNHEYYEMCSRIMSETALVINLDIDDFIDVSKVEHLEEEVRTAVTYLQDLGYENYEIHLNFTDYQSAIATRFIDDSKEEIYLLFEYANYSSVPYEEQLKIYIFDK